MIPYRNSFNKNAFVLTLMICLTSSQLTGQRNYPPDITCDTVAVYKSVDDIDLKLWIFHPPGHSVSSQAPAIVFYFGGGWNGGSPQQFEKQCEYLAARGMVAMVADYRVKSRHNVKVNSCVADAKSAIRWIREFASELGVDPDRIAAGGGSAGGHLAAATATLPKFDDPEEDLSISSKPNALVLFNPALVLAPIGEEPTVQKERLENLKNRLGAEPEEISPYHHIRKGTAPAIIFHGTADKTVPFASVEAFTEKMIKEGNRCKLAGFEGEGHGFFNYGRKDNGAFVSTVAMMDNFFVKLGWLNSLPEAVWY